ncbi:TPA: hypothetical protein OUE28_003474 [Morganella morganii]|uniref:hypothetical protein n=1 Tax=Morganella morganii TaxID=582 RepID=UPI00164C41EE|nr:hypothetical protein [Morganella morganii]MBC4013522.1 hypothetical protein [Morganella morganii]MDN3813689.1 hypothetical protein [Morganella morganii]HCU0244481.1 hypothetical protein [Morganella morganii]
MSEVTVACKLANGLYLDVGENREVVKGFANGIADENGFGLTHGVDKAHWDAWLEENKDRDLVKNGLIFAHEKVKDSKAESKEKAAQKSGTEKMKQNTEGVKTAEE